MILNLKNLPPDSVSSFGAKASALGRLIHNNINVPEGYVLSNEMFFSYLAFNKFCNSPAQYLSHNDEIQDFLIKGALPPDIKVELIDIYNILTDSEKSSIAVRSSAVCEDSKEYSMAGVFESFLNIKSYDELEHSIKKCYASLFSDKALALILRNNIKYENIGMGIVIQKFIEGDVSGVMFTADTITMDESMVVINAVEGLCSGFVDGTKRSSFYRANKYNGQIIDYDISQDTPEIKVEELKMIIDTTVRIDYLFGCCQDVEWTICNNKLFILQSRPITTFRANETGISWSMTDEQVDKTWNLYYPEPFTPLTEELLYIYNEGRIQGMLESGKGSRFDIKLLNGYAYFHIAPRDIEIRKIFREKLDRINAEGKNIFQDIVLPQLMQYRDELSMFLNRSLQIEELLDYLKKSLDFFQKAIYFHVLAVDGSMYLEDFKKYCMDMKQDLSESDFYDLVFQKSALALERERVLEIEEYVKSNDILSLLFDRCSFDEILYVRLTRYEPGVRLHEMIKDYLLKYGLIALKGYTHIVPDVIQEKPWEVLSKIRACIGMSRETYDESLNKTLINKKKILTQITDRLDENKRKDFMKRLKAAEKSFLVNDDHCFYIDLTSQGYLRLAFMKAGDILTERKVIELPEDIYFMNLDEVFCSLVGEVESLNVKIRERKEKHNKHKKLIPPEYLGKASDSSRSNKADVVNDVIKGVSGLEKRVTGRVKVINDSARSYEIKEDCILVLQHGHGCYFLPVMNRIKGLIYDEGSPFDHPGILAREFGIPSIYKTGNATRVLKDGDLVELDGIAGVVRIINKV